jgi:hypothetical protein
MTIAVFDYGLWAARYPELAPSINPALAGEYFLDAGLILNNTDSSPVSNATTRLRLLNMLVSHIAALNAPLNGQASSAGVGRMSSATEGSVSIQLDYGTPSNNSAWFLQTKYGAMFWQATALLRAMRYVPGYPPTFGRSPWWWGGSGPWR